MSDYEPTLLCKREACPACHSLASTVLYVEPFNGPGIKNYMTSHYGGRVTRQFEGFNYELVRCTSCTLAYQVYVPTNNLLAEIYDKWIPSSSREVVASGYGLNEYRYLSEQIQFIIEYFRLAPNAIKTLDFGFGWAEWAKMAAAYGCEVVGAELSQERISYAKSIGVKILDLDEHPLAAFHFINTEQVFEHLVQPDVLLARLAALLKVGGIIKVSVPDSRRSLQKIISGRNFSSLARDEIMPIAPFEHINSFEYRSLLAMAKSVGLVPLRPSFFQLYNSCSGWLNLKNALRMLVRPFYRHVFPKSTYMYFVRINGAS